MDYFLKNVLVFDKSVKMYIKNYFEKLGSFQGAPPPSLSYKRDNVRSLHYLPLFRNYVIC